MDALALFPCPITRLSRTIQKPGASQHPRTDRFKPFEPQQTQGCRQEIGQCTGTVVPVVMGIFLEPGIVDPVTAPPYSSDLTPVAAGLLASSAGWCRAERCTRCINSVVPGLSSLVPSVTTSTIQLLPLQAERMGSGAFLARHLRVISWPWSLS